MPGGIHKDDIKAEFLMPDSISASESVLFPIGQKLTPAYAATQAVTINRDKTVLEVSVTGAMTINLTISSKVKVGAMLAVKIISDGSIRAITPGTGMAGAAWNTVANKTHQALYLYDGTSFSAVAAPAQLN